MSDMTAMAVPTAASTKPSLLTRIVAFFISYNTFRAEYYTLSQLSDRQLDDIGLTRGDLGAIAMKSAEKASADYLRQ